MNVLFLTHRLPYAPNRGDRVRAFHIIRTLAPRVSLDLVSLVQDRRELASVDAVRNMGVDVQAFPMSPVRYARATLDLTGRRPLTHALLDAPGIHAALRTIVRTRRPDVVLAYCSGMARFAMEPPLADLPLVLDFVDVDSDKWASLGRTASWPQAAIYRREARCLGAFERRAAEHAAAAIVVNARERVALEALAPAAAIHVIPNGVDLGRLAPDSPPASEPRVVFCGVMNYPPNVEGVLWFARDVWPAIRRRTPGARFIIVGADPTNTIRRLASEEAGIDVTGTVPDVRTYLWNAAVAVAPLTTARGVQNKVLEALAAGLPSVITPQVLDGLPRVATPGCRVASQADDFAAQVTQLLSLSATERRTIAGRAQLTGLGWDAQLAPLLDILFRAARRPEPAAATLDA